MANRGTLFISHSSKDKDLMTDFGKLLRSVSLHQIDPWFSSDSDHAGGLQPGDQWFERIREKMTASSAVVALITKNSLLSKWVFFESGFGTAVADKKLILVTYNIGSMSEIPEPLSRWQAFRIDRPEGLREFCEKLLHMYDIIFDEILFNTYSKTFSDATANIRLQSAEDDLESNEENNFNRTLIKHFDRRFFELTSALKVSSEYLIYEIMIENKFDGKTYKIEIAENLTIQDVLDQLYSYIQQYVEAYTYLENWILIHKKTKLRLVVREVAHSIPAAAVFSPGARWIVAKLERPYKPSDSAGETLRYKVLED